MRAINEFIIIDKIEEEVRTDSGLILSGEDVNQMRYAKGKIKTVSVILCSKKMPHIKISSTGA